MFNDSYKRANDAIKLTDADKNAMLESLGDKKHSGKEKAAKKITLPIIAGALAACLVIAVLLDAFGTFGKSILPWSKTKQFTQEAKSYSEIYAKIEEYCADNPSDRYLGFDSAINESAVEFDSAPTKDATESTGDADFSETNVQVEGVDESDIVKTDGKYIYVQTYYDGVKIYEANGKDTKYLTQVKPEIASDSYYDAMYLYDDTLVLLYTANKPANKLYSWFGYPTSMMPSTIAYFYDVSDLSDIQLENEIKIDSVYTNSRIAGSILYVFTAYFVDSSNLDEELPETYIPGFREPKNGDCLIAANDICILDSEASVYTTVTAIDLAETDTVKSSIALLGHTDGIYVSNNNILAYSTKNNYTETKVKITGDTYEKLDDDAESDTMLCEYSNSTNLCLVEMNNGNLKFKATRNINGMINDQFAVDEYDSHFRIVTTTSEGSYVQRYVEEDGYSYAESISGMGFTSTNDNSLFVLDDELNITGKIEDIAKDEQVKSARFMGDVGFFVTFRQTDPLFSVDLSDHKNPKIIGTLKIPGFSEYLQSFGDGLLFGFGSAADIESGGVYGLKLSMFDISDPADVSEVTCIELPDMWSIASDNHRAILADANKNIIGFPVENGYAIYSYTNNKFVLEGSIICDTNSWSYDMRGMYIGDYYYIVDAENMNITVLNLDNFSHVANIH